ncbi:activator of stress 1 [Fusarium subglutinans]|uniref:Activator of stress 1 n=1 Tax=Gibberella subglutinans TaxID=42677 RepID=A0A8H5PYY2_GIBSU|nr:activator of stress 1 [Fusarium subglutinans]KAF5606205.1 activator of stress 1 [Fusarium subglutinans]
MYLSILRLLAVGLAGLNVAVAGPCKPRSSASESSIATTVAASSFVQSSDTSATFASTTTEAVTSADTTTGVTTEVSSAVTGTETASTEATTSGDTTTEATTFATSTAITEVASTTEADTTTEAVTTSGTVTASSEITEAPTTTTEGTTTAAPTTTTVPMFRLVPASGTYSGEPLLAKRNRFTPLLFNHAQGYSTAYFTIDATTGRLLLDGTLPICGYFPGDGTSAFTVCDATNMPDQEQYLTCETPTPGSRLECSVPEVQCDMFSGCAATGSYWYTTYIGSSGGTSDDTAFLATAGGSSVGFYVNFDSD